MPHVSLYTLLYNLSLDAENLLAFGSRMTKIFCSEFSFFPSESVIHKINVSGYTFELL